MSTLYGSLLFVISQILRTLYDDAYQCISKYEQASIIKTTLVILTLVLIYLFIISFFYSGCAETIIFIFIGACLPLLIIYFTVVDTQLIDALRLAFSSAFIIKIFLIYIRARGAALFIWHPTAALLTRLFQRVERVPAVVGAALSALNVVFSSFIKLNELGTVFCSILLNELVTVLFILVLVVILLMIRGGAPRYRIDQLSAMTFNNLIPLTVVFILILLIIYFII